MSLLRQLNNTQPGFYVASPWTDASNYTPVGGWIWIPSSDVSSPAISSHIGSIGPSVAFGKGRFIQSTFTTNHYRYHVWDAANTGASGYPRTSNLPVDTPDTNRPMHLTYANNMFMILPYNVTNIAGNVLTSSNGWDWTTHAAVLPSTQYNWSKAVYNTATGNWLVYHASAGVYRSSNNGANWTYVSGLPVTSIGGFAFGNGKYIITDASYNVNRVFQSLDDGASWQQVSIGSIQFINSITWNEYDSQFVLGGGQWANGTIDARISTSPDGTTWTAREVGSHKMVVNNVKGDNAGNYVAFGNSYASSVYGPNSIYLYSTNNAVTWTLGNLPASVYLDFGRFNRIAWGDITLGL